MINVRNYYDSFRVAWKLANLNEGPGFNDCSFRLGRNSCRRLAPPASVISHWMMIGVFYLSGATIGLGRLALSQLGECKPLNQSPSLLGLDTSNSVTASNASLTTSLRPPLPAPHDGSPCSLSHRLPPQAPFIKNFWVWFFLCNDCKLCQQVIKDSVTA
jgi:hypothetical protein